MNRYILISRIQSFDYMMRGETTYSKERRNNERSTTCLAERERENGKHKDGDRGEAHGLCMLLKQWKWVAMLKEAWWRVGSQGTDM